MRITGAATFAIAIAACSDGGSKPPASLPPDSAAIEPVRSSTVAVADTFLITERGIGLVKLGASLNGVRAANPRLTFTRTSDGDGVALVEIVTPPRASIIAYLGEEDRESPIDFSRVVESLETMSAEFNTDTGVHPGSLVTEVERIYGRATVITKSEIESREYITFENQPATMIFRLDAGGIFEKDSMMTTRYAPGATIFSIAVRTRPTA